MTKRLKYLNLCIPTLVGEKTAKYINISFPKTVLKQSTNNLKWNPNIYLFIFVGNNVETVTLSKPWLRIALNNTH